MLFLYRAGCHLLSLTARQYGEVVLPDEFRPRIESYNSLKICIRPEKEGMARVFAVQVQSLLRAGAIQVQG
jgi:hypothetical protein